MERKEERRFGKERRSGEDRRKFNDQNYKGPERRCYQERRTGENRRKFEWRLIKYYNLSGDSSFICRSINLKISFFYIIFLLRPITLEK